MAIIYTGKGQPIIVDDDDFEWLRQFAWSISNGYAKRCVGKIDGKLRHISMHRYIMDPPAHLHIDHINHCRSDNRRHNLRLVTRSENQRNQSPVGDWRYDMPLGCWVYTQAGRAVRAFDTKQEARDYRWERTYGIPAIEVIDRERLLPQTRA
jgi:hypothetical protein